MLSKSSTFDRALAEFAQKISELTQTAVDNRKYVLVEKLQAWMRESPLDKQYLTNTELLLRAAYPTENFLPIEPRRINEKGHKCSLVVFSILLDLGLGNWIARFAAKGILDGKLPFDLHSLERKLSGERGGDHAAERFNERQWKFCPAIFGLGMEEDYVENQIIPICRQSEINTGGTARVDQIVMQAEFVDSSLRNKLQNDHFASYIDRDYGHCFIFALKVFEPGSFQYYTDEKAAFDGLRENRGVIHRLGCYTHQTLTPSRPTAGQTNGEWQTFERKTTKNLLLEYGTYDLRLIFGHKSPPVFPKEILGFWEALFEVADAVSGIHDFKTGGSEFNGWHADIKPDNIIYVHGKYKLADPGFACFKKKPQGQKGHAKPNAPQIRVHGGTNTYGAPEVSSKADVHQTIDIWSLGCVFSMAATWVILGYQGVRQYLLVRGKALEAILNRIKEDDHTHPLLLFYGLNANGIPRQLDCFHDGTDVLKEVTSWHTLLRESIRKTDPITEAVLDLIDTKMLLRDPEKRVKSAALCEELRRIISSAKVLNRETVALESLESREHREHMEGLLKEIDDEVVDQGIEEESREPTQPIPPGLPATRLALKAQLEGVPLQKTSHRFETLPDLRPKPDIPTVNSHPSTFTTNVPQYTDHPSDPLFPADNRRSVWQSNQGHLTRNNTGFTSMTRKNMNPISPCTYENVLQARERLDRESKRTLPIMGKREPRKNEFLGKHFENRDIKYLVDDSESMFDHWDEATFLLETLVMRAHNQDPDGPDLAFMNDSRELVGQRDAKEFRRAMNKAQPRKDGGVHTNIKKSLERIFHRYLEKVQYTRTKSRVSSLTIIILTDGLWAGMMNDKDAIIPLIQNFYRQLKDDMEGKLRERQVSIQFVQFGSDQEARERLRRLDDDLPYLGIDDMVDHEMFSVNGNVFKMLLGSFVEEMDAMDEVEDVASSPDPSQQNMVLPFIVEEPQNLSPSQSRFPTLREDMTSPSRNTSSSATDAPMPHRRALSSDQAIGGAQDTRITNRSSRRFSNIFSNSRRDPGDN